MPSLAARARIEEECSGNIFLREGALKERSLPHSRSERSRLREQSLPDSGSALRELGRGGGGAPPQHRSNNTKQAAGIIANLAEKAIIEQEVSSKRRITDVSGEPEKTDTSKHDTKKSKIQDNVEEATNDLQDDISGQINSRLGSCNKRSQMNQLL
jgi:hypothetical protein